MTVRVKCWDGKQKCAEYMWSAMRMQEDQGQNCVKFTLISCSLAESRAITRSGQLGGGFPQTTLPNSLRVCHKLYRANWAMQRLTWSSLGILFLLWATRSLTSGWFQWDVVSWMLTSRCHGVSFLCGLLWVFCWLQQFLPNFDSVCPCSSAPAPVLSVSMGGWFFGGVFSTPLSTNISIWWRKIFLSSFC